MTQKRRALLSVSDKSGIADFARGLVDRNFEILSTGGTARTLKEAGIAVTAVSEVTGHPEIMEGRVKTLHPAIHGPLLARRNQPEDLQALETLGYHPIDVVAVNLYPFRETVEDGGVSVAEAMGKVDIGGPTMIRAAAKNHADLYVAVDPADYDSVLEAIDAEDPALNAPSQAPEAVAFRRRLAAAVFRHIAAYDAAVAAFLTAQSEAGAAEGGDGSPHQLPELLLETLERREVLRYGENPNQDAAFYAPLGERPGGIAGLRQHHGKGLSYNNLLDLDGALLSLAPFALSPHPAVCIVKHTTPCGLAVGASVVEAYEKALRTDPKSAFGSVIATNRRVDGAVAERMGELFIECIVAPSFSAEALERLTAKKNLRILTFPEWAEEPGEAPSHGPLRTKAFAAFDHQMSGDPDARRAARFLAAHGHYPHPRVLRGVYGGVLVQTPPVPPFFGVVDPSWVVASQRKPTEDEQADLAFAWAAAFGVKSNAILLAGDGATLGIGAGQMSRVDASVVAVRKARDAGLPLEGSVLASDAFFPFRDGVDAAAAAGVRAIVQPGGSMRDDEVIRAADEHEIAMVLTGTRLFRH